MEVENGGMEAFSPFGLDAVFIFAAIFRKGGRS